VISTGVGILLALYWSQVADITEEFTAAENMAGNNELWKTAEDIYPFSYTNIDGKEQSMEKYKGHVVIIANVASKCGLTCVNYEQLTTLYDKYSESEGLRIVAFPCNQFAGQEPLTEQQIKEFVAEYNVRYDMSSKINVNGANSHPLWNYLKQEQGGTLGNFIKWNFTKFLVDKKGNVVQRYGPTTNPKDMEKDLLFYFSE